MPQRLGGAVLAALAVVLGIYSGVDSWPWSSEVAEKPTAFIRGDASGSSLDTIYSDADFMVDGNARKTKFRNITHRTDRSGE